MKKIVLFVATINNNIHGAGMAALINSLPHRDEMRSIYVYDNQGNDSNKMTTVQVQAAKDKAEEVTNAAKDKAIQAIDDAANAAKKQLGENK